MMTKKRVIILGAGLAGLSAARHLQRKGVPCRIFEQEDEVGGLCRSKRIGGFTFDYTGHLLHFKNQAVGSFIRALLGSNIVSHKRKAWVYTYQRYIQYPFQMHLRELPAPIAEECIRGFPTVGGRKEKYFREWAVATFGKGICRHFLIPYNRKFWAYPLAKMTCEWTNGFIPIPTFRQVCEGSCTEKTGYNHAFYYPENGGIGTLAAALSEGITGVITGCKVEAINFSKRQIRLHSGAKERFDSIISTIPLPELARIIEDVPLQMLRLFKKLKWNSIFNLNLGLTTPGSLERHWVYFAQKELPFYRVGFYHTFSRNLAPKNQSSLYVEAAHPMHTKLSRPAVIKTIKKNLLDVGIIHSENEICAEDVNDIRYGYPIYDHQYQKTTKALTCYLQKNNIFPCGRYGAWRYFSMTDTIADGFRQAALL